MNTILCAGYPKSGNTLLGQSLNYAGGVSTPFDIYQIRREKIVPRANPLFESTSCCIKTHDLYRPFESLDDLYFGKVSKIVAVNRNPFDVLLSAINYFRFIYRKKGNKLDPRSLAMRSLRALMPDFEVSESFLTEFTLEKLRDAGMLDAALRNFGEYGTSILNFYGVSGTWSDFLASYDHSGASLLKFSYEKLERISNSSLNEGDVISAELSDLSSFLEVDAARLKEGFAEQKRSIYALKAESMSADFFNKSRSGYWKQYFSPKDCKLFLNQHYSAVIRNGYGYLVDEVNSIQ